MVTELNKGTILLKTDGKKHLFQSPQIDMPGRHPNDLKAIGVGTCQIVHIELWDGL